MSNVVTPNRWSVVVPVKLLHSAKTRLAPLDAATRQSLALAMATDTVAAALASSSVGTVFVVSDDAAAAALAHIRVVVIPDEPDAGLNAALEHGAAIARLQAPDDGVVALTADLPALKPAELDRALAAATLHPRCVVADAGGDGTVALTARASVGLDPAFGSGSLQRHVAAGAVLLDVDVPGLRRDVDTVEELRAAIDLGCGPQTAALAVDVLAALSLQAE